MKKLISYLLIAILLIAFFTLPATAASDFVIENSVLTGYTGNSASVTIPSGVYKIAENVFKNKTNITSVSIPSSVLEIADGAFAGCKNLETISGASHVNKVGKNAFQGSMWYDSYAGKLMIIGDGVLIKYTGSDSVIFLPETINVISPEVFKNNKKLVEVYIPNYLYEIADSAFSGCSSLETVSGGASLVFVDDYAFKDCTSLKKIELRKNVQYVSSTAFSGCKTLTVYAYKDTYAYKFALSKSYPVVNLDLLLGDVNGDGQLTLRDILDLQKYIAHMITLDDTQLLAADINLDGKANMADILIIQRRIAGFN